MERRQVTDFQFDFGLSRHRVFSQLARGCFLPSPSSDSIANAPDSYCASPHPAAHGRWTALPPSKKRLMNPDANIATPLPAQEKSTGTIPQPPIARREPLEHVLHGDRRVDHYAWLRHKENPEVIAYLEAENAYTGTILRPTEVLQEKLYQEMLGRILQTDLSVPYKLRGYLYFTRTAEGKQYPFHCRRRDGEGSAEELLLDLNLFAEGHSFLGLGCLEVSEDN